MKQTKTGKLVECALLLAVGTVLSIAKVAELPFGGSVTFASMLPILLISYRHGLRWGLGSAFTYAVLQQLLGLNNLSYVTTWQSVVAVIVLDYIVAFTVVGLGGIFRRVLKDQSNALAAGALLVSVLRYISHVIAGATVWAGISIPTGAALAYSLIYNATYMIPESIVLVVVAAYIGTAVDFTKEQPTRIASSSGNRTADMLALLTGLMTVVALVVDVALIFAHLQDPENGEFNLNGLSVERFAGSFWMGVVLTTAIAAVGAAVLLLLRRRSLRADISDNAA